MTVETTIQSLSDFCKQSTGTAHSWQGKSGHYQWTGGKLTQNGTLNGVVRKLAGISATGNQIWVVAGSFKIDESGNILRFTGISKKDQTMIARMGDITTQASELTKAEDVQLA